MANESKSHTAIWLVIILIIASLGICAFLWRDNQAKKEQNKNLQTMSELQKQLADLNKKIDSAASNNNAQQQNKAVPSAQDISNIESAISSGNTSTLEGYMASNVAVVIAASESAGNRTPSQAVNDLRYLSNATGPWNFKLDPTTLSKYQNGAYKTYFKTNTLVGKSANGYVVAFNFDSAGKINGIFMAVNSSLLE